MRLTAGMLKAMHCAMMELCAGESPQGYNEDGPEAAKIMEDAEKAQTWIAQEMERRRINSKKIPGAK